MEIRQSLSKSFEQGSHFVRRHSLHLEGLRGVATNSGSPDILPDYVSCLGSILGLPAQLSESSSEILLSPTPHLLAARKLKLNWLLHHGLLHLRLWLHGNLCLDHDLGKPLRCRSLWLPDTKLLVGFMWLPKQSRAPSQRIQGAEGSTKQAT